MIAERGLPIAHTTILREFPVIVREID
jgi:hypothetical protein